MNHFVATLKGFSWKLIFFKDCIDNHFDLIDWDTKKTEFSVLIHYQWENIQSKK
jgi:hypothetical protein